MYVPMEQAPNIESGPTLVVRTALDTGATRPNSAKPLQTIDRTMPVDRIQTMEQLVSGSVRSHVSHGDPGGVFDARTGDGVDRNLRGDELPGDSTDARVGIRVSMGATRADVLRLVPWPGRSR